jgi:hypothetical protein
MTAKIALVASALALATAADELRQAGAIRSDHDARWGAFRVAIDQHAEAVGALDTGEPVASPDATAFAGLTDAVQTLAMLVNDLGDQVRSLAETEPAAG